MLIKSKIILIIFFAVYVFAFNQSSAADEFNISATEISFDKNNNTVVGKGSVEVTDNEGKFITADKVIYDKTKEFLTTEGSVKITDKEGNIITTNKATYDKIKDIIVTFSNSELILKEGYFLKSNKIEYDNIKKIISSGQNSILADSESNTVNVSMFQYYLEENLFSSIGKIKIIDKDKNEYFFKELHVDTKKKEMIGSSVSVLLDQKNFGVSEENDPRFVANDIFISDDKSNLSKAVFTVCKKKGDQCPPWSLKAKRISHDKVKKTIYYEHATLKIYDIPIFYFPRFFHPDPTVKRQSGFLIPFFTDSTTVGAGFGLPYYWAVSKDKDITFTPKFYNNENFLLLNEYRQAFRNGFLTLDTSYTQGYKNTSKTKTDGSRSHIFTELDFDLGKNQSYDSNISFKTQRTSNDTYFRIHDINTTLVNSENTDLRNEINYNFSKGDMYLNISGAVYENLREETNNKYEYVLPNIVYGKTFFTERFGSIDFKSNAVYKNYDANKHSSVLTNDIIWSPSSFITKKGFVNTLEAMIKNTNYEARNTTDYKTEGTINEVSSVLGYRTSLPMKKDNAAHTNIFSPNFMVRYAPFHMKDLSGDDANLKYSNLYSLNKTSEIEDGLSAILGFDYKVNTKNKDGNENEKFSLSMGQVFNRKKNQDIPSKSSLDQKMSDVVGEINYNFSQIGSIGYKFALDHNLNDLNYNEISTTLNFGKVGFNLNYLEEQNHIGDEHYVSTGINLSLNDSSNLKFQTKKNFKTNSIELYDINYQYELDCLTAGLVYRREFYVDRDVEKKDTLMFTVTFVPFAGVKTPTLINP